MVAWKKASRALTGLVLVLAPTSLPDGQLLAKSSIAAFAAALRDPMALFAARSPGARGAGATYQTKPAYSVPATGPIERVLSSARQRPGAVAPADPALAGVFPDAALPTGNAQSGMAGGTSGSGLPVDPPIAGGGGPGYLPLPTFGSGSGGGGGFFLPNLPPEVTPSSPPSLPPVGAVPEPSTWALFILGFGLVGAALRHGRSAGAQLPLA